MTDVQIFAFYVLPLTISAFAIVIAYFYGRDRKDTPPGE